MAILKCKMCGGDLTIQDGMTVAECEYCGTKQTVPTADNEKKMTLFARANRLRAACEFDKAAGVYESIVADFPEEAEAYWGMLLCKFGIEYVDDPATGKKIPTCHRSSFESIMDDSDFEQVMENADPIARRVYREEAKTIEELRKNIIEVSSKEEPYDIFICYKETDENGSRTIDSVIAQDVYDALTEKGYRVFFSRITLEDKLGQEYEPYIFAALNSAKVMLAFGTDYEYYNAVWVKNEWSRFLALIAKGEKKTLIPCYKGIDAYDMPKEFRHLQAQDMGKVGATQDLLRGINKIIPKDEPKQAVMETVVVNSGAANVAPLIKRTFMYLEDGKWEKADEYAEKVLDQDPENVAAYIGKMMSELHIRRQEDLVNQEQPFDSNENFKKAIRFGDDKIKKQLNGYIIHIDTRNKDKKYDCAVVAMNTAKTADAYIDAAKLFKSISGWKDADELANQCLETRREIMYNSACTLQKSGKEKNLNKAAEIFGKLNDYKDSSERMIACKKAYEEKKAEREVREKRERSEREAHEKEEAARRAQERIARLESLRVRIEPYRHLISAGMWHTLGIKPDGTVVALGFNKFGQCNTSAWKDIVAIASGSYHSVGLRADGTVVATKNIGKNYAGQCDVSEWKDIVAISAARNDSVGLKSDGTVVATTGSYNSAKNWKDIVAVSTGGFHIVGLRADGTVVADGSNSHGESDVSGWKDIVAISAGESHTVGLKADGTVVATRFTGNSVHYYGQCDVSDWKDIIAVSAGTTHTIGLKADGTVVATKYKGDRDYYKGQCDVFGWKLLKSESEIEADYNSACRWQESGQIDALKQAEGMFKRLRNYKDSAERVKACSIPLLNNEKTALRTELSNLKGIFSGRRRKQIEARLAEIEKELKKL